MTKFAEDIIIRPIITEKSYEAMAQGKYTFEVSVDATKIEIKDAVENLFSVKVLKVNTMRYEGKMKRVGAHQGKTKAWKKAIVQIDTNPSEEKYMTKGGKVVSTSKKYKTEIEEINSAFAN
ncbi:MAG: 50S ribosomal protein L23 [Clostridia bacterium]|nr:50S ribosomal protein L23 [Clostridia bacterium]MDD4376273.1 50S ribosomal protein L23 [Clostridia bacterium]